MDDDGDHTVVYHIIIVITYDYKYNNIMSTRRDETFSDNSQMKQRITPATHNYAQVENT